MIHVFIGTKAQYIKTAPLIRTLESRGLPYRLIDSGQHAELSRDLRTELGIREPDVMLGGTRDIVTIPQALAWAAGLAVKLAAPSTIRSTVFGGHGGVCVVHGDTPSTLLSTLMARRGGLRVAHMEAGLRSHRLLHPFPEEMIRIVVMRLAHVLFAPDTEAVVNLKAMRVPGEIVPLTGNTSIEAVRHGARDPGDLGPAIFTMHRVENLHRPTRVQGFVAMVLHAATLGPVRLVLHGPTRQILADGGHLESLADAGVDIVNLVPHGEFVAMLDAAPYVVTDGGSVQEECALLGVPTLLWRDRSERPNGIGENVVVSRYSETVIRAFLARPDRYRRPRAIPDVSPSGEIVDRLVGLQ
jgi:UDP-N-acetylglucosamine 2-epimerase